jgi:hypothetical protein
MLPKAGAAVAAAIFVIPAKPSRSAAQSRDPAATRLRRE